MNTDFIHQHTAHCESGVASSLLKSHGLDLNESMVFGIASALAFVYLPFYKIGGMPLIAYRGRPGNIIKNTFKCLDIKLEKRRFSSPKEGMNALDNALDQGRLVGLQSSVYWLPYFPEDMRFHFNVHQILVYGKEGNDYLISDPVFDAPMRVAREDLEQARFAKGSLSGNGLMYTLDENTRPQEINYPRVIQSAIKKNSKVMRAPIPIVGVKGIHYLANYIGKLATSKKTDRYKKLFLGHIVRMQEEIGTGGGGFRYLYAYFLEQAAVLCNHSDFKEASEQMTHIGDQWRLFARDIVIQCRELKTENYASLANSLHHIANEEEKLWCFLEESNKKMNI